MLINCTKNTVIAKQVEIASTFGQRFLGLMGRKYLSLDSCLIITKCNSVHTCFMHFPLDLVFLNKDNIVIHTIENMLPFRCSSLVKGASTVVELASGKINTSNIQVGHLLSWS